MTALFYAHSGLRYLVLLAALVAVLYYGYGLATRRSVDRAANVVGAVFTGTLDLQILLGLILLVSGIYYPALVGHIVMMVLAALVAHGSAVLARGQAEPGRYYGVRLAGVIATLVLIVGGVAAIGRSVLESGAPSVAG
jgi:hypothetical protein